MVDPILESFDGSGQVLRARASPVIDATPWAGRRLAVAHPCPAGRRASTADPAPLIEVLAELAVGRRRRWARALHRPRILGRQPRRRACDGGWSRGPSPRGAAGAVRNGGAPNYGTRSRGGDAFAFGAREAPAPVASVSPPGTEIIQPAVPPRSAVRPGAAPEPQPGGGRPALPPP